MSPRKSTRGKAHNRGGRRGLIEETRMLDAVEGLLLHRARPDEMSEKLADEFGRPPGTPIPLETLGDYVTKVNARWQAEHELTRAETKQRQLRRLYRRLRGLQDAGSFREAAELEKLIAKIEGNLAPIAIGGPDGGPITVRSQPEILSAFDRLAAKTQG